MAETLITPGVVMRENDISFITPSPVVVGAAIIGPAVKGPVEIPTRITSYGQYQRIFGTTFQSGNNRYEYFTSLAVKSYFEQGGTSVLVTRVVSGSYSTASSTKVLLTSASAHPSGSFKLETLGKGTIYNSATGALDPGVQNSDGSLKSGSVDNLRWEIAGVNPSKGTFTLVIRRGDDSLKNKIILETFTDVSLDPTSENYIERVVGNQYKNKNTSDTEVYIESIGNFPNRSNYVRVAAVYTPTPNYLGNDGVTVNVDSNGSSYSGSLPVAQSGSFYGATGTIKANANYFGNISSTDTQGLVAANYTDAITLLGNVEEYKFNVISAPGLIYQGALVTPLDAIVSLAETRGDCIAVIDMESYGANVADVLAAAVGINSSYTATYWPWLQVQASTGQLEWVPASVVVPGAYAFTDRSSAPWFAPAGMVRGGLPNVIQVERKLTTNLKGTLYAGNVNSIGTLPGAGICIVGQKTLQKKASALDRVNVRRLLIELKEFIGNVSSTLLFEQNSIATRNKFLAKVNPYMDRVVERQGLYGYRVVMDENLNTADIIDRNQLVGQIYIQPVKSIEYILLDFTITPTGVSFN